MGAATSTYTGIAKGSCWVSAYTSVAPAPSAGPNTPPSVASRADSVRNWAEMWRRVAPRAGHGPARDRGRRLRGAAGECGAPADPGQGRTVRRRVRPALGLGNL